MLRRRGEWVYREPGKAGADLLAPPFYMAMLRQQRDFATEVAKVNRRLTARHLSKIRQAKAKALAARILEIAKTVDANSRHKRIARLAGCSVATVKRALAKGKQLTTKGRDTTRAK